MNASAGIAADDNINNGQLNSDKESDSEEFTTLALGKLFPIGDDDSLAIAGNLEGHLFNTFEGLNNVDLGLTASYKTKLGIGYSVPWIRLHGSATRLNFNNDVRDGWIYHAGATIGKRINERWSATTEWRFEKRTGDNAVRDDPDISGAVFDQIGHSLLFNVNYLCSATTALALGYNWRSGDVAATTKESDAMIAAASAITPDNTFGEDRYAYKLHAITRSLSLELNRSLDHHSSINISYQRRFSQGDGDFNYYNSLVGASFLYSY